MNINIKKFASLPTDDASTAFNKLLIFVIAFSCCLCGIIWGLIYCFVFGLGLIALLPFSYTIIVGSAIIISHLLKNHKLLIYVQIFCITWITPLIQWGIGSMSASGLVVAWSFLGPLGALIFLSNRQAIFWMFQFLLIVFISAFWEPKLLGEVQSVSPSANILFYCMNLGMSSIIVFVASSWFVSTIKKERGRAERLVDKIRTLFGQHVSREVANELMERDEKESLNKIYEATILFLDIRDFTVLADSRIPDEVASFQNTLFGELMDIVKANKGIVIQLLGDGLFAVFGAPIENETHCMDAVNAGFEMLKKAEQLGEAGRIPKIKMGIGVHCGKVMAGEIGNEDRKAYSLAGTNVNIAARIEQLNKEFGTQFLISNAVQEQLINERFEMKSKGDQMLRGISEPVGIYQLV